MVETVGRVFAAVPLPSEVRLAIADSVKGLRIPGRVAPPENWHITLRFLGTIDEVTYDRFLAGMTPVEDVGPFRLRLTRYGAFPNSRRATVVWVGVGEGETQLERLNEIAEEAAEAAGMESEERPYHPHLTLSRVRPPESAVHLLDETLDIAWRCNRVVIYRSRLGGGPAQYEPLETFQLSL